MSRGRNRFLSLSVCFWLATSALAFAQTGTDAPVLVTADSLTYDQEFGVVKAAGGVELAQGGRTLLADLVSYSERDDKVVASGNVTLMEQDGSVLFADYMELTSGMRNGFIRDISFLLSDYSRGAAAYGERRDGNTTVMHKAVYTTCELCPDDRTRPPLWQIRSDRVIHDQQAQEIMYRDAWFEMFGIPILYTPYFSHPDPTVNRRSGFLPPSYLSSAYFGQAFRVPYYYVVDDNTDVTLMPQYSTDQGGMMYGELRQRRATGEYWVDASITQADKYDNKSGDEFRGHIRANMAFRYNDDVTWGANIFRASDDTYLNLYNIPEYSAVNALTSRVYAQAINNRHFAAINAFSFQNLRAGVRSDTVPIAAPIFDYSAIMEPGDYGGRWAFDANMASIYRQAGTDMRRLSTTVSWTQPYYASTGEIFTATALLRADGYWVNDVDESLGMIPSGNDGSNFAGRAIPLVALDWRYPFVRDEGKVRQLIEPIVSAVITPHGGNPDDIPNEDSLTLEFDETNLFNYNRFPGYDRWDGGPKLNYGLRAAAYGQSGGYSELLLGQSLRTRETHIYAEGAGLNDRLSDYVGRLTISPGRYITLVDRIRLAQNKNLDVQRHELTTTLGTNTTYLSLTYANVADTDLVDDGIRDQEAVSGALRLQLTKYWGTEFRHTRELGSEGGSLLNFGALRYTDECFDIVLFAQRTFTVNRDIQPDTTIGFRFRIATFN
jgi:LPS-assembly protein